MKHPLYFLLIPLTALLLCGCTEAVGTSSSEAPAPVSESTTDIGSSDTASETDTREPVADGIYRVTKLPQAENVEPCIFGKVSRSSGGKVREMGKTLNFSRIPNEFGFNDIPYCICKDEGAIYAVDGKKIYKSDLDLQNTELLCTLWQEAEYVPAPIHVLLKFPQSERLFFQANIDGVAWVGSIDPASGEETHITHPYYLKTIPCAAGVMLYDYDNQQQATVLYWDALSGNVQTLTLNSPREATDGRVYISANGKYLCTYQWGKTQDDRLVERYSAYEVASGAFLRSFDWTFRKTVGESLPTGFTYLMLDEATESIYVQNTEDRECYQLYFGGAAS